MTVLLRSLLYAAAIVVGLVLGADRLGAKAFGVR